MSLSATFVLAFLGIASPAAVMPSAGGPQATMLAQDRSANADVADQMRRAQELIKSGKAGEAEALLQVVLTQCPNCTDANKALGGLLLEQHRFDDAGPRFESVLTTDLRDPDARRGERQAAIGLALQLRNAGKQAAALAVLQHAQLFLPEDTVLLTDLGIEADAVNDYEQSVTALESVLKQKPDDPVALYALARTDVDRDHPQEAENLFRAYFALRPDDASAHYGFGRLLQMQQRTDEAAVEFHRSLEIQPVQTESYYQLGQMALDAHRDAEARAMFEKTLSRLPTHGGARTGIGILDYRVKSYDAARKSLEQAVTNAPDYQPAHYYLGLTLARLGEKEDSTRELAEAADLAKRQQDKSKPIGGVPKQAPH